MTEKNPITIVINRPHGDPVRLRVKGSPTIMDDGSITVECRDEKGGVHWVSVAPEMLKRMHESLP